MTDFKVGDRVRFTGWFHKDKEGEIISRAKMYDWKVRLDGGKSMTQSGTPVHSHEIELIEKKETPMTHTFKVGDRVRITTRSALGNRWTRSPNTTRAERGTVATVKGVMYGMVEVQWFDGLTGGINDFHPEELILVTETASGPLKETLAEVDAKLQKAVADQADAKKAIRDAEAVKALQDQAIARAKKRDAEANDRIIAFGDQIVKLKELEGKKKLRLEPGRTVQVKAGNFRFPNQYGTVDRVGGTNWVEVSGPFYDLYGKHYGFMIFSKEEVEVVR